MPTKRGILAYMIISWHTFAPQTPMDQQRLNPFEIELKFRVDDPAIFRALSRPMTLGAFRLQPVGDGEHQHNTYYDTPDFRLRAQRYGLRVRTIGHTRIATLKGETQSHDGLHQRPEWEAPVESDDPQRWPPGDVRDRALALAGGAPLRPVLTIETLRRLVRVWRDAHCVAEMALDEGVIYAGGREQMFYELEIEALPEGTRDDLHTLGALLQQAFPLQPDNLSKLARGLALLDEATSDAEEAQKRSQGSTVMSVATERLLVRPLALTLLDRTASTSALLPVHRRLLGLAAACYDAALAASVEAPERAARDMLLSARIDGLDADQQALAAALPGMVRAKTRPRRDPAFIRLSDSDQKAALRLGAVLRLAAALAEQGASTLTVTHTNGSIALTLAPGNSEMLEQISARSDLWRDHIGPITFAIAEHDTLLPLPVEPLDPAYAALKLTDGLQGSEPLAEGARRVLRRTFERLLTHIDAVEKDDDPEDVHDARVVTRRLRASLQVVEGIFDSDLLRELRRGLRRVARSLGVVRDYDVFLEAVCAFRDQLPDDRRSIMEPLIIAIESARAPARARLIADLESKRFERFLHQFAVFLTTPGAGVVDQSETGAPTRVRDFAGSAIWRRYEQWRAFDAVLDGAPDEMRHKARIAGKRLRYTLEFFADALGPGVDQALGPLMELQELLGNLQDAVVAREHIRALGMTDDPGAQAYLAALDVEHERLLTSFSRLWAKVDSVTYRRRLFELIIRM
ncbi:MAG: CYTH and CHAD domain-containing protein [Roseiflexus sp.]|nr:CYTH and CHAD domain-containing protein [Roseiflexus sp.]MCS7290462.1 CYTH and CHAD domain-containing protein [Roseiflexus sp.]MDW8147631.1 CYTH and CHAD domain-containing protein [Roseiflexaceae bacterium]MDW8231526.1 CYTH and CHAD domain-containing protein [Roseiflexaceae bacterium]